MSGDILHLSPAPHQTSSIRPLTPPSTPPKAVKGGLARKWGCL